jgi:hypothetical protein
LSVTSAVLVAKGKTIIWLGAPLAIGADCICGPEEVAPAVRVPAVGKDGMLGDDPEQALTASAKNAQTVFGMIDLIIHLVPFLVPISISPVRTAIRL